MSRTANQIGFLNGYGYTVSTYSAVGGLAKFGPLLTSCNTAAMKLTGATSRKAVVVPRSALGGHSNPKNKPTVVRGPMVKYTVTLSNKPAGKIGDAFDRAGLVVTLPAGVTYVKSRVFPTPYTASLSKRNKTLGTATFVAGTYVFPDAPLTAGKTRKYMTYVKVQPGAASPLVFRAICPNCPALATRSNVTVRA